MRTELTTVRMPLGDRNRMLTAFCAVGCPGSTGITDADHLDRRKSLAPVVDPGSWPASASSVASAKGWPLPCGKARFERRQGFELVAGHLDVGDPVLRAARHRERDDAVRPRTPPACAGPSRRGNPDPGRYVLDAAASNPRADPRRPMPRRDRHELIAAVVGHGIARETPRRRAGPGRPSASDTATRSSFCRGHATATWPRRTLRSGDPDGTAESADRSRSRS